MKFELYPASPRRSGQSGNLASALKPVIKGDRTSWPGFLMITWPKISWSKTTKTKRIEVRHDVSSSALELETAKEILAEVFHAGPGDVEEMIQMRLEERNWIERTEILPKEREEVLWPAAF